MSPAVSEQEQLVILAKRVREAAIRDREARLELDKAEAAIRNLRARCDQSYRDLQSVISKLESFAVNGDIGTEPPEGVKP